MGFREKVTLSLVIVIFLQITCRHCMPSTPRKSTLKGYPNNFIPNNPKSTTFTPTQTNKAKKNTHGKQQTAKPYKSLTNKSLYKAFNFAENDYPLDSSPKDSFNFGKNYNVYNKVSTPRKNVVSSDINNLKRDMKMKRKLTNNKQSNFDRSSTNNQISLALTKLTSDTEPRVLDSATFPDVQYPTNTMETWAPNYWNYLSLTQNEQQMVYPKASENNRNPIRLTKAKANRYLQPYAKLKEESDYAKASSKRSHPGGKGLNFTKTATSEKNSEDIITTSLISNFPSNSSNTNKTDIEITPNSNTSESGILNKVENKENQSLEIELQNNIKTQEHDSDVTVKATDPIKLQTAQIQPLSYTNNNFDLILGNSNDTHEESHQPTNNTFNDINNDVHLSGDTPKNMSLAKSTVDEPTDKLIIPSTTDANDPNTASGFVQNNLPSMVSQNPDNIINNGGPLNVKMPFSYGDPISNVGLNNIITSPANYVASLSNGNTGSGTSIIIIPINNGVNNPQSDTPIIVYIPTNPLSRDTPVPNYPHDNNSSKTMTEISNNTTLSPFSNITQMFNDNPTANAFVSELPLSGASSNYVTDGGSRLPIFETLPRNSMCYNNANCPSSFREDSSLSNPTSKTLTNSLLSNLPACGTKDEARIDMKDTKTEDQPSAHYLPVLNFPYSDLTLLSEDLYNKIPNDELPITVREVPSDILKPHTALTNNLVSSNVSSLKPQYSSKLVDKSVLVRDALKNATLTLFPPDKQSLPVYNAVLKVLLCNATIRSMLAKKNQPSQEENRIQQVPIPDTANSFPVNDIVLYLPPSNVTTTHIQPQPVNKAVNKTLTQNQMSDREQQLNQTETSLRTPHSMESFLVPILLSDLNTKGLPELRNEIIVPHNQTTNTSTDSLPLSRDFSIVPLHEILETNSTSEIDIDNMPNNKRGLLSNDHTQSVQALIGEFLTPAKTSEKRTTWFPMSPPPLSVINGQINSDNKVLEAVTESQAISNLAIIPKASQWSEEINVPATDNYERLYDIDEKFASSPYNGFDMTTDTQPLQLMKNTIQQPDIDTAMDIKNSFTKLFDTPPLDSILDDQVPEDEVSLKIKKVSLERPQPEDLNDDLPLLPDIEINKASSKNKMTARDSILFPTPLSTEEVLPDKVLDTSGDMASSQDGSTLLTDKARTETGSNIPDNDLSLPLDIPPGLDEPQLTVYEDSYIPLDGQSLLKNEPFLAGFKDDADTLIDFQNSNRDLPPLNDYKVPITVDEPNSSSEVLTEDFPSVLNDSLTTPNIESLERLNTSDIYYVGYDNQLYSELGTSNSSFTVLLEDWSRPLDEILHNITRLDNYSNNLLPENIQTYTLSDPTDLISSMDIDNLVPHISKEVSLAPENSSNISTHFEETLQSFEIADLSKLKDETQQDLYLLDRKGSELPSTETYITDISEGLTQTVKDKENQSLYPDNSTEDQENFTEVKPRRPMSLPMAKAILENVLFNIYTGGLSIPVDKPQRNKKQNKLPTKGSLKKQTLIPQIPNN